MDTTARRYRILETLGEGGFGKVYRAEMQATGGFLQHVAIKIVSAKTPHADEAIRRLRDEARILGHLRHRAVIRTLGLTRLEPGWAIVLEYVDGADCSKIIRHLDVPLRVVVEIAEDVASALAAAWNAPGSGGQPLRLIHRDIKPANIRITSDGQVRVLDFGAARAEFDAREASTRSHILGSYRYMAPERFQGKDAPPVDVYSLGLVIAQLVTREGVAEQIFGELEHARMVEQIMAAVVARIDEESPEQVAALQPLVDLIEGMLAFHPEARPSHEAVERVCRDLREWIAGPLLRDWAPGALSRLPSPNTETGADEWSGSVLIELSANDGMPPEAPVPAQPAPRAPPAAHLPRWIVPAVAAAVGFLLVGGVVTGIVVGRLGATREAVTATIPDPVPAPPRIEVAVAEPAPPSAPPEPVAAAATPPKRRSAPASITQAEPPPVVVVAALPPPEPAPPAGPTTVRVTASGDATQVVAMQNGERVPLPASLVPGHYRLSATFPDGETWTGDVDVAGESVKFDCSAAFGKCKRK